MAHYFPLADPYPGVSLETQTRHLRAKRTGTRRRVRKGDWYLSGAPGFEVAYHAFADYSLVTDIVDIVHVTEHIKVRYTEKAV